MCYSPLKVESSSRELTSPSTYLQMLNKGVYNIRYPQLVHNINKINIQCSVLPKQNSWHDVRVWFGQDLWPHLTFWTLNISTSKEVSILKSCWTDMPCVCWAMGRIICTHTRNTFICMYQHTPALVALTPWVQLEHVADLSYWGEAGWTAW